MKLFELEHVPIMKFYKMSFSSILDFMIININNQYTYKYYNFFFVLFIGVLKKQEFSILKVKKFSVILQSKFNDLKQKYCSREPY